MGVATGIVDLKLDKIWMKNDSTRVLRLKSGFKGLKEMATCVEGRGGAASGVKRMIRQFAPCVCGSV